MGINPLNSSDVWASWSVMGYGTLGHSRDGGQSWTTVTTGLPATFSEPLVRPAALMAALDAEGQALILTVLEAYRAWDHYLAERKGRTPAAPPVTIPGLQPRPEADEASPMEALSVAVAEVATRVAVLEQIVPGPRPTLS